jgi:hypothetical protein
MMLDDYYFRKICACVFFAANSNTIKIRGSYFAHVPKSQVIHVINEFFIKEEYNDFRTLFWIPEFLSNPYRERYFTGSSISSTR